MKKILIFIFIIILLISFTNALPQQEFRRQINITAIVENDYNSIIKIPINSTNFNTSYNYSSILFTDNNSNIIPFWYDINNINVSGNTYFYVNLSGKNNIYLYYSKNNYISNKTTTGVFVYFEDFNSGSLNSWNTKQCTGSVIFNSSSAYGGNGYSLSTTGTVRQGKTIGLFNTGYYTAEYMLSDVRANVYEHFSFGSAGFTTCGDPNDALAVNINRAAGTDNYIIQTSSSSVGTGTKYSPNWITMSVTYNFTSDKVTPYYNNIKGTSETTGRGSLSSLTDLNLIGGKAGYDEALIDDIRVFKGVIDLRSLLIGNEEQINQITNFSSTAIQNNGSQINTFNMTMYNGTTSNYNTTNGIIITEKLSNSTSLYNITFSSIGFISRTYNNINLTTNTTLQSNLTRNNLLVSQVYPSNNYHTQEQPINLTYNLTTNISTNCDIKINGIKNITQTFSTSGIKNYSVNLSDNSYNWSVNCSDGLNTANTSTLNFVIDTIKPVWNHYTIATDNTTAIDRENQPYLYLNDTLQDNYIFMYNVTVKYPNGSLWFYNDTYNTTASQINLSINRTITASQPNGTYSINYYAEDDHTAKEIPNYNITQTTQLLKYITPTATIQFEPVSGSFNNIGTTKLTDRYTFEFTWTSVRKEHEIIFSCDKQIYYRENLYTYPTFVCGKQWVDFNVANIPKSEIEAIIVKQLVNDKYSINVKTFSNIDKIQFNSLGGLNIVNDTYTFNIFVYNPPNITGTYPSNNFLVEDGTTFTFQTNATDPANLSLTYRYYYDGILNFTGQNNTFTAPFNEHGPHTMTVNVTNSANKVDSYTWNFNITHSNVGPNVTSITYTPFTTWYSNLNNTYIYCSGFDADNETPPQNWTVEISYKTGLFLYTSLSAVYDSGNTWKAFINVSGLENQYIDARCRISDGEDFSDYYTVNNMVFVEEAYYPITEPYMISPNAGLADYVTPVICHQDTFGSIPSSLIKYDIDAYYEGSWHNLSYDFTERTLFDMAEINYSTSVYFRCRLDDGLTITNFINSTPTTRQHINNLFMYSRGQDEIQRSHKQYYKGLKADFYNEVNISIIAAFADCNGDQLWDYYWSYNTTNKNNTKEDFACYNSKGLTAQTVGIFINKTGRNDKFCGTNNGVCKVERTYGVLIK